MKGSERYLAYIYYLITVLFLTILAVRALTTAVPQPIEIIIPGFIFPFLVIGFFRWRFEDIVLQQVHHFEQPKRQLIFDFSLFVLAGLMLVYFLIFTLEQNYLVIFKIFFYRIKY